MAIYSLHTEPASRSAGRNAVAMAAYRSGGRLVDERTGQVCDYSRKRGVIENALFYPAGVHFDRQSLWNMAEQSEKRKDARTAREIRIALPHELDKEERKKLAAEFARELVEKYQVAVDLSLHNPNRQGDDRNFHAHLLLTTRRITPEGLADKSDLERSDKALKQAGKLNGKEQINEIRQEWENLCNMALERSGRAERVNAKSYKSRNIEQEPTIHLGPAATAMERRGIETDKGTWNRIVKRNNLVRSIYRNMTRLHTAYKKYIERREELRSKILLEMDANRQLEEQVTKDIKTLSEAINHNRTQPPEKGHQEEKRLSLSGAIKHHEAHNREEEIKDTKPRSLQEQIEQRRQNRDIGPTRNNEGIER